MGGSAGKVKTERGSNYKLENKLTQYGPEMGTSSGFSRRSREWRQKLVAEVNQLL